MITALLFSMFFALAPGEVTTKHLCGPGSAGFAGYRYPGKVAYCRRTVTKTQKLTVYAYFGIPKSRQAAYTIDHVIPLCAGGSNDTVNLVPQLDGESVGKDGVERQACSALRAGRISQADAIRQILAWTPKR